MTPVVRAVDSPHELRRGRWFGGRRPVAGGSVWPGPRQELLLKAALLEGDAARRAWLEWADGADLGRVEGRSAKLLALAHRNLLAQGVHDPRLERLKPYRRRTWGRNQQIFQRLNRALGVLHASGIETLVVKGAALVPCYYRDASARGMGDFDVLVREDRFQEAYEALRESGWSSRYWLPEHFDTRFEHAIALFDADGYSIDLHCHLLMACCGRGADDPFWEASVPATIAGVETRTLCAADHLIHACVHGMNWVNEAPLRWVADAVTVIRSAPDGIDWEHLIRTSRQLRLTSPVVEPLEYLARTFGVPIPPAVRDRLHAVPVTRADRQRFRLWTRNRRGRPVALFLHHYHMYARGVGEAGLAERVRSVPEYLRFWAHTDRLWRIPLRLGLKAWRVIGYRLGLYRYWDG
ncbi:MAG TPA: nucleotidyltransferase family protein [Gemmatimonadota bacterium]|nr:nucleotidyltransferase family protein [Gemmatimonadota bacterium]